MKALRKLSIAVANGRVGFVFLIGNQLCDWHMSRQAFKSTNHLAALVQKWINDLKPDVVITEKVKFARKKGQRSKRLISAIAELASHNYVLDISVKRVQKYANKYEEAAALVLLYPELRPWLPKKRRFFDNEPRETILFEALSLALESIKISKKLMLDNTNSVN